MNEEWTVFAGLLLIGIMVTLVIVLGSAYKDVDCWDIFNKIADVLSFGSLPRGIWAFLQDLMKSKTVYNVDRNMFTYADAPLVCAALGGTLATKDQMKEAYEKGANWCNYGWVAGQEGIFPIQASFMSDMRAMVPKDQRDRCGKIGINGGYFSDGGMRFGVNCYGKVPTREAIASAITDTTIDYDERGIPKYNMGLNDREKIEVIRELYSRGELNITPFYQSVQNTPALQDVIDPDAASSSSSSGSFNGSRHHQYGPFEKREDDYYGLDVPGTPSIPQPLIAPTSADASS
jgi:hypothetical protein